MDRYIAVAGTLSSKPTLVARRAGFQPRGEYTYVVGGHSLTGDQIVPGNVPFQNEARALAILQRIQTTANLVVWHDPQDPSRAVLHPHAIADAWLAPSMVLAIAGFFGAALLLVGSLRRAPARPVLPARVLVGIALITLQAPATMMLLKTSDQNRFVECGVLVIVAWSLGVVMVVLSLVRAPGADR